MKEFEFGGVKIVRCAVQGWRKTMEDVALIHYGVSPRKVPTVTAMYGSNNLMLTAVLRRLWILVRLGKD